MRTKLKSKKSVSHSSARVSNVVPKVPKEKCLEENLRTFLFDSFKALLSRPVLSNSIILFSYGSVPATSRTRSRISFTRLPQRWVR